tara:strand:+ start:3997 stop:4725 length:729 start_codon:yes stop_codon:yes gene_type:complete
MSYKTNLNYAIFVLFFLILYGINIYAFKNGYPTCENYVTNTYLYLALSICYIYFNVNNFKQYKYLGIPAFIFGIALLLYMSFYFPKTKEGIFVNHLIWFSFLSCLSFMIIPVVSFSNQDKINMALFFTFTIFILMSSFVYLFPKFFQKTFYFVFPGLLIALLMIILIELYFLFIRQDYPDEIFKFISYAVIVLFSLYISYDTQLMFLEAKQCRKYANYPKSSIKFILDVVNIFVRTLSIQQR